MQMLANGKPELSEEERIRVKEKLKEIEARERFFKERKIEQFIKETIGIHYLKNFDEKKIRDKDKLDKKIEEMFETGKGMILFGDVGVGKTTDLVYIIKRIYREQEDYNDRDDPDIPIAFYFMRNLFNILHQGGKATIRKYVILDDWGREYATDFSFSQFEGFIEEIYSREIRLVITTNLTKEQLINREGWLRITDRVREMCSMLEIPGRSMRHR